MPIDPREQSGSQRFFGTLLSGFADVAANVPKQVRQHKEAERQRKRQDLQDIFNSERLRIAQEEHEIRKNSLAIAETERIADKRHAVSTFSGLLGGGQAGTPFASSFSDQSTQSLNRQIDFRRDEIAFERDAPQRALDVLEQKANTLRIGRANQGNSSSVRVRTQKEIKTAIKKRTAEKTKTRERDLIAEANFIGKELIDEEGNALKTITSLPQLANAAKSNPELKPILAELVALRTPKIQGAISDTSSVLENLNPVAQRLVTDLDPSKEYKRSTLERIAQENGIAITDDDFRSLAFLGYKILDE